MLTGSTISKMGYVPAAIIGEAELIFFHQLMLYGTEALCNLLLSYYLSYDYLIWSLDPHATLHLRSTTFHNTG
jgi:hypothetical protein